MVSKNAPVVFLSDVECQQLARLCIWKQDVDADVSQCESDSRGKDYWRARDLQNKLEDKIFDIFITHRNRAMNEGYPRENDTFPKKEDR